MKKCLFILAASLVAGSARAQEGFFQDQYRLPPHTAFICRSATEKARVYEYIKSNYPRHHNIEGSRDGWSGKINPPTQSEISYAVLMENLRWQRGCSNLCPILKPVKPIGNGWVNAGQYGRGGDSYCYDTWVKLVSRNSGRIEIESTSTSRLSERSLRADFSSTHQIKCSTREYWSKSTWAPINSRTLLDKATKTFC